MEIDKLPLFCERKMSPPRSVDELLSRCQALVGKTLGQVAQEMGVAVPADLQRHKGWVGALFESVLGADAGNKAEPDFMALGIELKTLPLNKRGLPKESTYVCTVSMQQTGELDWQHSWLRRKLAKVLWLPIEAESEIPLAERYVGQAWLWVPSEQQEAILRRDWEELIERVVLGEQSEISASEGEYLQIRPKAANSRVLAVGVSSEGLKEKINPKGFYLRTAFTRLLLEKDEE
jgi:DNA mismatch repair protein MutH